MRKTFVHVQSNCIAVEIFGKCVTPSCVCANNLLSLGEEWHTVVMGNTVLTPLAPLVVQVQNDFASTNLFGSHLTEFWHCSHCCSEELVTTLFTDLSTSQLQSRRKSKKQASEFFYWFILIIYFIFLIGTQKVTQSKCISWRKFCILTYLKDSENIKNKKSLFGVFKYLHFAHKSWQIK